jgi:hypothetical protein
VLDAVERTLAPEEREEPVLERVPEHLAEIPDRLDVGIARQDLLHRVRVVGVDQERHLLRFRPALELGLAHLRQSVEVRLELRALLRETGVADLGRLSALDHHDVLLEQRRPGGVAVVELRKNGAPGRRRQEERRDQPPHACFSAAPRAGSDAGAGAGPPRPPRIQA